MTSNRPSSSTKRLHILKSSVSSQGTGTTGHRLSSLQDAYTNRAAGPSSSSNEHTNAALLDALPPVLQDALTMSQLAVPVGTQQDDQLLVRTLYESDENDQTYRQALENLHGAHGHTATQWRDYFLDHGRRIFKLLNKYKPEPPAPPSAPPATQASTSSASAHRTSLPQPVVPNSHSYNRRSGQLEYSVVQQDTQPATSSTRPITRSIPSSSQTGPSNPVRGRPLLTSQSQRRSQESSSSPDCPARNPRPRYSDSVDERESRPRPRELIPPRLDRSPTPPTRIVPGARGNSFTDEDRRFMVKFLLYEVGKDPTLSKAVIQRRLEEKAPHHSATSWGTYWLRNADAIDKVYNTAKAIGTAKRSTRSGPRRRSPAPCPPVADRANADAQSGSADSDHELSDWDSDPDTDADVAAMGGHGDPWTLADKRVVARYIVGRITSWNKFPRKDRFAEFLTKYNCKRSIESCESMYRYHGNDIDRLVRKYRAHLARKKSKPPPPPAKAEPIHISLLSEDEEDKKDDTPEAPHVQKRKSVDEDSDRHASTENAEKRRKTASSGPA